VIEGLYNCREQKYTGKTNKTIYLIKVQHFIVAQKQYIYDLVVYYGEQKYTGTTDRWFG
jgi:hypothetical protein